MPAAESATLTRSARGLPWAVVVPAAIVAVFVGLVIFTAWLGDDAYITFRTIDNFRHGYGLRWNVAERVQTYTHPLWLFALAGAWTVTGEHYFSSLGLSIACSALAVLVLAFAVARDWRAGALGAALVAVSRAFVDYSTSGLENPLSHLLLASFLALYWVDERSARRVGAIVAVGALAAVNRLDLALLLAPALLHVALGNGRSGWRWIALGAVPLVAWEVFSVIYYGFPFPNTAYAKLPPNIGLRELVPQGLTYLADSLRTDPVTGLCIALGLVSTFAGRSPVEQKTVAFGIIAYLLYVVGVGGDFMTGRFLTVPFLASVALIARRAFVSRRLPVVAGGLALVALGCATTLQATVLDRPPSDAGTLIASTGIADERRFYSPQTRLIDALRRRQAPVAAWERRGRNAGRLGIPQRADAVIGFFGYGAGPAVFIVDPLGLGDPLLARLPAVRPWRIGHFRRNVPDGYVETASSGQVRLSDPALAARWREIASITRGPIWSRPRWKAILDLNLGGARSVPATPLH